MAARDQYLGVDLGSRASKAVVLAGSPPEILATAAKDSGTDPAATFESLKRFLTKDLDAPLSPAASVVTGYGRGAIEGPRRVTEISCHARGVRHLAPQAASIVEIGGQDSKLIRLGPGGEVHDFAMNDRCAAGTGRFLEMVARVLGRDLSELDSMASDAATPVAISSTCVVFAESEIISLLSSGARPEAVVAGVFESIAQKVAGLAARVGGLSEPVVFAGGVAQSRVLAEVLTRVLGAEVRPCTMPLFTGALGAALLAAESP
jgi:predicted CoA-substrate-specific enzyme activase